MSNDLRVDAERDLRDIGAGKIEVHPLNKVMASQGPCAWNNVHNLCMMGTTKCHILAF